MTKESKKSKRLLLVGMVIVTIVDLTAGVALADRDWRHDRHDWRRDHHVHREHRNWWGWTGTYYVPPPVVYGYYDPYYYPRYNPPPVVYGGPGLSLNFNVR